MDTLTLPIDVISDTEKAPSLLTHIGQCLTSFLQLRGSRDMICKHAHASRQEIFDTHKPVQC